MTAQTDLELELALYATQIPFRALVMMEAMGVSRVTVARLWGAGDLGLAWMDVARDFWEPEGREARAVIAVRDHDGALLDICAIRSSDPDSWAVRTGDGWALGLDAFHRAWCDGAGALRIFGTPMAWLSGFSFCPTASLHEGGSPVSPTALLHEGRASPGICVLDWSDAAVGHLRSLGPAVTLLAENAAAAAALRDALRWRGLPGVEVKRAGHVENGRQAA